MKKEGDSLSFLRRKIVISTFTDDLHENRDFRRYGAVNKNLSRLPKGMGNFCRLHVSHRVDVKVPGRRALFFSQ
jgi:hypothetical protein